MVGLYSLRETSEYVHHAFKVAAVVLDFFVTSEEVLSKHTSYTRVILQNETLVIFA